MRTTIALICLTGPSLYLAVRYLRQYGFAFGKENGWGVARVLAMLLLVAHVVETTSGRSGEILDGEFFPFRAFLFFAVSGAAYGAAIFPQLMVESPDASPAPSSLNRARLVAIPAWIWIFVLLVLAAELY